MFGPDAKASLTFEETKQLAEAVNAIHTAISQPIDKNNNTEFTALKSIFEKSLALNKDLPKGHRVSFDDLEAKKPKGFGIAAADYHQIIGKTLKSDKLQWDFLNEEDLI